MSGIPNPFENRYQQVPVSRPNFLDVVKINGRWAQVLGAGNFIKYLDDESTEGIDWDKLHLTKSWEGLHVWSVKKSTNFTPDELGRIHWGPEQKKHPHLREAVSVFGEYEEI